MKRFLRLFSAFRGIESALTAERKLRIECESASIRMEAAKSRAESEMREWVSRYDASQRRIEHLTEKIMDAGDAVAIRAIGRKLYGKTVEAAVQPSKGPVNISSGSNKRFGRDVVRQQTADFFRKAAQDAGVLPTDKTN